MIIGSGWAKGMKLKAPGGVATRPTSAKVRAAALNMLAPYIEGARFLDVFAGSGAMGIESLSRGASACVFVESGRQALQCLSANLSELKRRAEAQNLAQPEVHVIGSDAAGAVSRMKKLAAPDIVFIDPPYHDVPKWIDDLIEPLAYLSHGDTILVLEHAGEAVSQARIDRGIAGWELTKQKSYGETMLTLLTRSGVN